MTHTETRPALPARNFAVNQLRTETPPQIPAKELSALKTPARQGSQSAPIRPPRGTDFFNEMSFTAKVSEGSRLDAD